MAYGFKSGGRKKGTPNKLNADVKNMVLTALNDVGGKDYLVSQAKENPTAFLTLVGKILPTTLSSDPENPLVTTPLTENDRALISRYLTEKGKKDD